MLENPTVFVGNDSREEKLGWMFIHQEYRDYCKLTYDVTCLKKFLAEEGFPVKLTDSQLGSVISKIRRKLQNYPNRHWKDELDNMSGQNIRPGQIAAHDQIGATDIYVIMKALVHSGFRQIDEMNEVVNNGEADDLLEKLRIKAAAFLELINVLDFKSMLIGTSDFKEKYLDALFRLENKNLPIRIFEIPRDKQDEVVRALAQNIENAEKYVDFDIQLPIKKQMYEAACSNDYSTIYKIIISCKGQYGWLYQILGVVLELYPLVHGKFQDYISMPKPNGYKALHATVDVGDGMPVTIVIRQTRKLRNPGSKVYLPPPVT